MDVVVYPIAKGRENRRERGAARSCASDLRQKVNDRTAAARLKRLIACNFSPQDWVITLTYCDQVLPRTPEQARDQYLKPFIKRLREALRDIPGAEVKYIYVIEGLHGDKRLHHHMIVPDLPGLREIVRREWQLGYWDFERISFRGYDEWARYLTKEPRKTGRRYVGERMWTPSIGLKKPEVEVYEVPDGYRYEPPPGVVITNNEDWQTEWWQCQYISYFEPEYYREGDGLGEGYEKTNDPGTGWMAAMPTVQTEQETITADPGDEGQQSIYLLPDVQQGNSN